MNDLLAWTPLLVSFVAAAGAVYAAIIARNSPSAQAKAIRDLSATVSLLNTDLDKERQARKRDRELFENELFEVRAENTAEIKILKERLSVVEQEKERLIIENHELRKRGK